MIIDTEPSPKSATVSDLGSPQSSNQPGQSIFSHHSQYHVSYSTFSETHSSRANIGAYSGSSVSDITGLLSQDHPHTLSDDDLPPAYNEIHTRSNSRRSNRFWTRCAGIFLTILMILSTWYSYEFAQSSRSGRNNPPSNPSPSTVPPPDSNPSQSPPAPPSSKTSSPSLPGVPTSLPSPPAPNLPEKPYLAPDSGRQDLCRPWAYAVNSESLPSIYDHTPIERLEYTIPSRAPIHIETSTICTSSNGENNKCGELGDATDAVTARLVVSPAPILKPKVELYIQYGSEALLEGISICMTRQPLAKGEKTSSGADYRWALGINTMKNSGDSRTAMLSSINILVSLPTAQVHDFSTNLRSFHQTIGYPAGVSPHKLSFGTLRLAGNHGSMTISDISSRVVEGISETGNIEFDISRVSESLKFYSEYGNVGSNITLVHGHNQPPIQVDTQSTAGTVGTIARIEYPSDMAQAPVFDFSTHTEFGRAIVWIIDPAGTASLRADQLPSVLPTINVNVTSNYATAQAHLPPTYHGTLDLSSQFAAIVKLDHAKNLPGRSTTWHNAAGGFHHGLVQWDGRHENEQDRGSLYMATQYAAARLLFLGLEDNNIERWPKDGNEVIMEP